MEDNVSHFPPLTKMNHQLPYQSVLKIYLLSFKYHAAVYYLEKLWIMIPAIKEKEREKAMGKAIIET